MMTRKDFELIAGAIREASADGLSRATGTVLMGVELTANRLADALKWANPNFDPKRFLEACGF